jgi:two-component system, response regulator YesN
MMLKVLIVDDDILTLTGLKTMIDWEKEGFEICGEAKNGANAIQLINNNPPHIVITDMNMPGIDGIGLMEYIGKEQPQIKVIALSGYADFDYVKQSMEKGAIDYILKHKLSSSALLNALDTARKSLLSLIEEDSEKQKVNEQLDTARTLLKQEFISRLVSGGLTNKNLIEHSIKKLNLAIDLRNLILCLTEIDDFLFIEDKFTIDEKNNLIKAFIDISQNVLSDFRKVAISYLEKGKFIIIFSVGNLNNNYYMHNQINTIIDRIRTSIKRYLNITACFSISSSFNDITEIHKYYSRTEKVLREKFYKGKDLILSQNTDENPKENFITLNISDEKYLTSITGACDRLKVNSFINDIFSKIVDSKASYESIQMVSAEMIHIVNKVAKQSDIEILKIYSNEDVPYSKLQKYGNVNDIKQWILGIYDKIITLIEDLKVSPDYSENTRKAIGYIRANYGKNISLKDVSEYIGVNSSYLSRVFKEDCSIGFSEYLNVLRVEKTKLMIEEHKLKLKDIVNEVGFANYNYFFKVFKDITGLTPLEYEESLKNTM